MSKKIICMFLIIIACFAFCSCKKQDYTVTYIDSDPASSADCPFQRRYTEAAGTVYKSDKNKNFSDNLDNLLKKKPETVICLNGDAKADMLSASRMNGDITFVLQDIKLNGIPSNMICVNVDCFTTSFVVGNFAGYFTGTAHVSFIAQTRNSVASRVCDGFAAGAEFASQGTCDTYFADEEEKSLEDLAKKAAEDGSDVIFVYSADGFDKVRTALADTDVKLIGVDREVDDTVICSFGADMEKIYTDLINKINDGSSGGTRLNYGLSFFDIKISDSPEVNDSVRTNFEELKKDVMEGNLFIPEKKDDGNSDFSVLD